MTTKENKHTDACKVITGIIYTAVIVWVVIKIIRAPYRFELTWWAILAWVLGLPAVLILITEVLKAMPTVWAAVKAWVGKFLKGPDGK